MLAGPVLFKERIKHIFQEAEVLGENLQGGSYFRISFDANREILGY